MNLINWDRETWPEGSLISHIRYQGGNLDSRTEEAIEGWLRSRVVLRPDKRKAVGFGWRLTIPFFMLWWLILGLVILPLKWLFTGQYLMSEKDVLLDRFFRPRGKKLFPDL